MPHTNQRGTNFNRRTSSAAPVKNTLAQTNPCTQYNPQSNSTLTKPPNNYSNTNYSNNKYIGSGSTQKNYSYSNYNKDDKAKDTKSPSTSSKLPSNQGQPSNDKAGNPICYKYGKIGFARDCPRHPYKPRVFTLGINKELVEAEPEPQDPQVEEEGEPSPEPDYTGSPVGNEVEDQYIDNPYDPENLEIIDKYNGLLEAQVKSPSFNMLSFIDATANKGVLQLASGHASENKSIPEIGSQSSTSDGSKVPNKVIKQSPPILDAKLRLLHEVGKYPSERSADLCHTLTAEVKIGGIDAFVLFDSGAETDALSPDFIRACHILLLELPNPLVLQMGTKGSCSCVYYGTNIDVMIHRVKKHHYFDIVNINQYDAVLGAPWLNTHGAVLDFTNHTIHITSSDIQTFDVLTEHSFCSVGSKAHHGAKPPMNRSMINREARKPTT